MSGASGSRAMADVVLPLLRGGIISAWGLTFVILLREMPISIMLATPGNNVISTYLFTLYDSQTFPAVAALAVVIFLVSAAGLALIVGVARLWRPASGFRR
jgi:iron(III) transport system permease protein